MLFHPVTVRNINFLWVEGPSLQTRFWFGFFFTFCIVCRWDCLEVFSPSVRHGSRAVSKISLAINIREVFGTLDGFVSAFG